MKQRIYTSISLLIVSIILTVIGIVLIQDNLSIAINTSNEELLKQAFSSTSYKMILVLFLQSLLCSGLWLIIRNTKTNDLLINDLISDIEHDTKKSSNFETNDY